MKPKQIHWRLLRLVSWLSDDRSGGLTAEVLSRHVDLDESIVDGLLSEIACDVEDYGPWVYTKNDMWYVAGVQTDEESEVYESTGGWAALDAARRSPYIQDPSESAWRDEADTGMRRDGRQSTITRAVMPSKCPSRRNRSPEEAAHAMNARFFDFEEDELD